MRLYVSLTAHDRIAVFGQRRGCTTPAGDYGDVAGLNWLDDAACPTPGALAKSVGGQFLFAATDSAELAAFAVERHSGRLRHLNTVPAAASKQPGASAEPIQACIAVGDLLSFYWHPLFIHIETPTIR